MLYPLIDFNIAGHLHVVRQGIVSLFYFEMLSNCLVPVKVRHSSCNRLPFFLANKKRVSLSCLFILFYFFPVHHVRLLDLPLVSFEFLLAFPLATVNIQNIYFYFQFEKQNHLFKSRSLE